MSLGSTYEFRLQRLLDMREKIEDDKKVHFMEACNRKNKVESNLNNLQENYIKYSTIQEGKDTVQRKIQYHYLNLLTSSIEDSKVQLVEEKKVVEEKRIELVKAQVDKKTVEILKEKSYRKFIAEENHIEQLQNDEFALYGYIRERRK